MRTSVSLESIHQLIEGNHHNPFELLGPHVVDDRAGGRWRCGRFCRNRPRLGWSIRPTATPRGPCAASTRPGCSRRFAPVRPRRNTSRYLLRVADEGGKKITMHDPYAFPHLLTEYDLYLLNEGRHWQSYNRLGRRTCARSTAWRA